MTDDRPSSVKGWRTPQRRTATWALLVLGAGTLAGGAAPWLRTTGSTPLAAEVAVAVTGSQAAPLVGAAALVVLTCGVALALVGRIGRWFVLGSAVIAGVAVAVSAGAVVADPEPSALSSAADATGVTVLSSSVTITPFSWLVIGLGALTAVFAGWAASGSGRWAVRGGRHDLPSRSLGGSASGHRESAASPGGFDDHDAWDALSRGEDPS